MDKSDTGTNKFVHRHLSQLKVLAPARSTNSTRARARPR